MSKIIAGLIIGGVFIGLGVYVGKELFGSGVTFVTRKDDTLCIPLVTSRPPKLFLLFPVTRKYKFSLKGKKMEEKNDEYLVTLTYRHTQVALRAAQIHMRTLG